MFSFSLRPAQSPVLPRAVSPEDEAKPTQEFSLWVNTVDAAWGGSCPLASASLPQQQQQSTQQPCSLNSTGGGSSGNGGGGGGGGGGTMVLQSPAMPAIISTPEVFRPSSAPSSAWPHFDGVGGMEDFGFHGAPDTSHSSSTDQDVKAFEESSTALPTMPPQSVRFHHHRSPSPTLRPLRNSPWQDSYHFPPVRISRMRDRMSSTYPLHGNDDSLPLCVFVVCSLQRRKTVFRRRPSLSCQVLPPTTTESSPAGVQAARAVTGASGVWTASIDPRAILPSLLRSAIPLCPSLSTEVPPRDPRLCTEEGGGGRTTWKLLRCGGRAERPGRGSP